ncbi:MAG: protein kinase, partial [Candidatus Obscuribacterales bacterium]|nr:protein kinase [Candidatus Obscuribacterales bacterium]
MRTCPTCGKSLPQDAVFCGFDGTILTKPTLADSASKVCPKCRKIYPSYAGFCPVDSSALVSEQDARASRQGMSAASSPVLSPAPNVVQAPLELQDPDQSQKGGTTVMDNVVQEGAALTEAPYLQASEGMVPVQPDNLSGGQTSGFASSSPETDAQILATSGGYMGNLIGKTVDKYLIQSMIGEGGMAVVYKAHHTIMERTVVIKVMQGWLLSNTKSIERFQRECKLTAKLNHPNIVTVYDVGAINGKAPYLVMEYIKGESLADRIQRQGALSFNTTANIIIQICRGLQEAHNLG